MILALVTLLGVLVPVPAGGTYHYVQIVNEKRVATESVAIRWSGTTVDVTENRKPVDPNGVFVDSQTVFDAVSLSLKSYRSILVQGCGELQYNVDVRGSHVRAGDKQLDFGDASHFVMSDTVALPFFAAAQLSLWRLGGTVAIDPVRPAGVAIERASNVDPARPAGLPSTDALLIVRSAGSKHVVSAVWYDPATSLVDEVDTPSMRWKRVP